MNDNQQAGLLARNRRIGVGHIGVQVFLARAGHPLLEDSTDEDCASGACPVR